LTGYLWGKEDREKKAGYFKILIGSIWEKRGEE